MTPVIVLAGGKSSRMGTDKTKLLYEGETLLERAVNKFSKRFEVAISANYDVGIPGVRVINDIYPALGPISGLHASLQIYESVFLVAADMPFADPIAASEIIEHGQFCAACAATIDGRAEPMFAYYSKIALPEIKRAVQSGDYSLHRLLSRIDSKLYAVDSKILVNINRPEDYEKLKSHIELDKI